MSLLPPIVVSRCDRIGDLVLSLPVLGYLKDQGFKFRILHCSAYASPIGEWALQNGLCEALWKDGDKAPQLDSVVALSLFHCRETVEAFKKLKVSFSLGPRSKLSTLWSYSKTLAQHRSRVEKSEARYNLDLAYELCRHYKIPDKEFQGLPALKVPSSWNKNFTKTPPDIVINVCNKGSAQNWPIEKYISWAKEALERGRSVDFLISGQDEKERGDFLRKSEISRHPKVRLFETFADLKELIAYVASAKLLVSSSTGTLHIAHAAGVEVIGIYPIKKVESFERWRPDGYWHTAPVRLIEII